MAKSILDLEFYSKVSDQFYHKTPTGMRFSERKVLEVLARKEPFFCSSEDMPRVRRIANNDGIAIKNEKSGYFHVQKVYFV